MADTKNRDLQNDKLQVEVWRIAWIQGELHKSTFDSMDAIGIAEHAIKRAIKAEDMLDEKSKNYYKNYYDENEILTKDNIEKQEKLELLEALLLEKEKALSDINIRISDAKLNYGKYFRIGFEQLDFNGFCEGINYMLNKAMAKGARLSVLDKIKKLRTACVAALDAIEYVAIISHTGIGMAKMDNAVMLLKEVVKDKPPAIKDVTVSVSGYGDSMDALRYVVGNGVIGEPNTSPEALAEFKRLFEAELCKGIHMPVTATNAQPITLPEHRCADCNTLIDYGKSFIIDNVVRKSFCNEVCQESYKQKKE